MRSVLRVLDEREVSGIHEASLRLLSTEGIRVEHENVAQQLIEAGAFEKDGRLCIPEDMCIRALSQAPKTYTIRGRDDHEVVIGRKDTIYAQSTTGAPRFLDSGTGIHRDLLLKDLELITLLSDALPELTIVSPGVPRNVPPDVQCLVRFKVMLQNTVKPLRIAIEKASEAEGLLRMLEILGSIPSRSGKPSILTIAVSPISPLFFSWDCAEILRIVSGSFVPIDILPAPMMGATAPITLAGGLVLQNAEILATITIIECLSPGSPVCYSPRLTRMDMRLGQNVWGNPETGIAAAASVQMASFYELPCGVNAYSTSSKTTDVQCGYEKLATTIMPALAGADVLASFGSLADVMCMSLEQMVVDAEIHSIVKRIVQGVKVSEDSLATTIIGQCLKDGFLCHPHTLKYLRTEELWEPRLSDRRSYSTWINEEHDICLKAKKVVNELLRQHVVPALDNELCRELDAVIRAFANRP